MKFKLVAEEEGRTLELNVTGRELEAAADLMFMLNESTWRTLKLNGVERPLKALMMKVIHLEHDVRHGGLTYRKVGKRWVTSEERTYVVRKPQWTRKPATAGWRRN